MKHLTFAVLLAVFFVSSASAGPLTRGIQFTGGDNSLASFVLEQAEPQGSNTLELRVSIEGVKNLKGCAFALLYDSAKYQLVESGKAEGSLFDRTGQPALFFANETREGIVVGAMKIDGEHTSEDGPLATFTFKVTGSPSLKDFRIADGVMVDLGGDIDAIMDIKMIAIETPAATNGLSQNIPNPFNPATLIEYQLAEAASVHIVIYNLLGQEIRTLVKEDMAQGHYSVVWDGMNELGRQVASGVYVYRMSAGDFVQTQRMMLLK